MVGGMLATIPASFHMKRVGRQRGFIHGSLIGIAGALVSAVAIWLHSFWLLLWRAALRCAECDRISALPPPTARRLILRGTAISPVLASGLVGGVLGPGASRFAVDFLEPKFMGAFSCLSRLRSSPSHCAIRAHPEPDGPGAYGDRSRPIVEIAAQPKFIVATLSGAIGYGVMYFLMTSAPIAYSAVIHTATPRSSSRGT